MVEIQDELVQIYLLVRRNHFIGRAVGQTGLGIFGAGLGNEDTHPHPFHVLFLDKLCKIIPCGICHSNLSHVFNPFESLSSF